MASWRTIWGGIRRVFGAPVSLSAGGAGRAWIPLVREPFTGAWQRNLEVTHDTALSYTPVFTCVDLISNDCAKVRLRLVEQSVDGVWLETTNSAYSPLLRRPNRYQTPFAFIQQWMTSKLIHGNTYVLKERDARGVVAALYVLDPTAVTPLIARDGAVYYQLHHNELAGLTEDQTVAAPSSEIIHDRMICPFHPLVGVSPIFAAALPLAQGLAIESNSQRFFANASHPGGTLTVPGNIPDDKAAQLKADWKALFSGEKYGEVAILPNGIKYDPLTVNASDAQLVEQLKWTAETICAVFHVPAYMAGFGPAPPYAGADPLVQSYYSQSIQRLFVSCEQALDAGLEFPRTTLGTEFDIDDLLWLNPEARSKAASEGIASGAMAPNEARKKYLNLPPVVGGETPYLQQQNWPLSVLAERDPPSIVAPGPPAPEPEMDEATISEEAAAELAAWWGANL